MLEVIETEPRYKRWGRGAFFVLTPLAFIPFLLRGRQAAVFVSDNPFWISNHLPSSLPTFLGEIVSYGYYQGTVAALLLPLVVSGICHRCRPVPTRKRPSLVWYLPAFAAGIEAMRHAYLLGRAPRVHGNAHAQPVTCRLDYRCSG